MDLAECDPVCLDAILNGKDISNKQAIYEAVIIPLLRMLYSLKEDNDNLIQLLTNMLGERALLLEPLDGVADQYSAGKVSRLEPSKAFKDAWNRFVEAMVIIESADREWLVVSKSSPCSVLGSNRLSLDV